MPDSGMGKAKMENATKSRLWWGRLPGMSRYKDNKYEVIRCLWKGVTVPSIMYGMEVLGYTTRELGGLKKTRNRVGRLGLGANGFVLAEAIRGEMGWSSCEEIAAKSKLNYRVRLDQIEESMWINRASHRYTVR